MVRESHVVTINQKILLSPDLVSKCQNGPLSTGESKLVCHIC